MPGLARALEALLETEGPWLEASRQARRYFITNHVVEVAMPRFEQAFQRIAALP